MIRTAQCAEIAIVYGNRYRVYNEVDAGLNEARSKFYLGDYKKALDIAIKSISIIDSDITNKLFNSEGY